MANAEALRAADEIISLDPSCPEGHWLRGTLRTAVSWEWAGGLEDLRHAQALDPRNAATRLDYARALASTGHLPEALAITREVATTDPLLIDVYRWMGWYQSAGGDPGEAARTLQRGLEIHPGNPYLLRELGFSFLLAGRQKEAQETFERNPVSWIREMGIALVEHDLGREPESRAALDRLVERNQTAKLGITYQIAQIQAWRGDTDDAFAWLDRACSEHDGGMSYLPNDPLLRGLRSDPRYRVLLGKMNLPVD
jgi:tetratricopeptide (TPR) repeat protein